MDINRKPAESNEPAWYRTYFIAVMERNRSRALVEMGCAQKAMQERVTELRNLPSDDPREMLDLNSALTYLDILLMHFGQESGDHLWDLEPSTHLPSSFAPVS